jgi:hypothetical protein
MPEAVESADLQRWARTAGLLYLLTNATAVIVVYARGQLILKGDAAGTAANIVASERLFRLGIVFELVTVAGVVALVVALHAVLRTVSRELALMAAFWRLMETASFAAITFSSLTVLTLLDDASYLGPLGADQRAALGYSFLRLHNAGFQVAFLFLGLGSAMFAWLWWRSRYIPRALAGLGIVASLVMAAAAIIYTLAPSIMQGKTMLVMAPMGLFEIGLGLWLLVRGIRT